MLAVDDGLARAIESDEALYQFDMNLTGQAEPTQSASQE